MAKKKAKGASTFKKTLLAIAVVFSIGSALTVFEAYRIVYGANVVIRMGESPLFYVPTGSQFDDVVSELDLQGLLNHRNHFIWLAKLKKYDEKVRPGRYRLRNGMTNNELVNMLRAGLQEPVKVTFNNVRLKEDLAGRIGRLLEADSTELISRINDPTYTAQFELEPETFLTLFLPNTYEFWWNTTPDEFFDRMAAEHKVYWSEMRLQKAKAQGLSPVEASILASIVEKETNRDAERPTIAGVYLNRLRTGMALQADPTLVFANRDFNARRVLHKHKEIDSPYNTYKYTGLPPGPICIASTKAIDAVLDAPRHSYIYFCAKPDGTGYHDFSTTYAQHMAFARAFQRHLNKRNIR